MVHWYQWYDWKIERHILVWREPNQVEACNGYVHTSKGPQIHPNILFQACKLFTKLKILDRKSCIISLAKLDTSSIYLPSSSTLNLKMNFFRYRYMFINTTYWVSRTLRDTQIRSRQNLFSGNCLVVYQTKGPSTSFDHFWKLHATAINGPLELPCTQPAGHMGK